MSTISKQGEGSLVIPSRLNLFGQEAIDYSIEDEKDIVYSPLTPFDSAGDLAGKVYSFTVNPQGDQYLDLKSLRVIGKLKVVKYRDGTAEDITDVENMSVINGIPLALFKLASVTLNSTEVASCSNYMLPLKAFIETSLSSTNLVKNSYLKSTHLWLEGDDSASDTVKQVVAGDTTSGFAKRKAAFCNNAAHEFSVPLHIDLFSSDLFLIPGVTMRIDLSRNANNYLLLGTGLENFGVQLMDLKLKMRHVQVSDAIANHHAELITMNPLRYHIPYAKMSSHTVSSGVSNTSIMLAQGKMPSLVLVGFMKQTQFTSRSENPFVIPNMAVDSLYFTLNGKMIPGIPFTPNYAENLCLREYEHFVSSLGLNSETNPKEFTIEKFKNNMTLYALNLSHCCNVNTKHSNPPTGQLEVHAGFSTPPTAPLEAISYAVYNSQIIIDKDRHVFFEI